MSFGSHYISWTSMCFLSYWCKRRLLISKTWHNNTDNHEKETEKKKKLSPGGSHMLARPWRWLCQPFKSNSKVEILVSKKLLRSQKVPYLAFTSVPGNPLSIVRFPLKHGHHCRVYMWTLPQCDGSPWDRGELPQNAVAVLFCWHHAWVHMR